MRPPVLSSHRSAIAVVVLLVIQLAHAGVARGQAEAVLELDIQRLLFDADQRGIQDPVWDLSPEVGKQFVLLPFVVKPVERQMEIARPPISLRGGRFIGFVVPAPDAQNQSHETPIDFALFTDQEPGALDRLLFGDAEEQQPADGEAFNEEGDFSDDGGFEDFEGFASQSESSKPPRLTRKIALHPDGSVHWAMDRSIGSAKLRSGDEQNLYPFKIDSALLREKEPPKAERITRQDGESSRDYADRRRRQQLEEREKIREFRELRDSLRDLPEQFSEPSPTVVYAVIEVREGAALSLQGPAPFPWSLEQSDRELLGRIAQQGGGANIEQRQAFAGLARMVDSRHALDAQAVALATLRGGVAGGVTENSPGFQLLAKLLASDDPIARRIALYAVARAEQPTRATARLLEIAGQTASGSDSEVLRLAALRTLFEVEVSNAESTNFLVRQVNQLLADPEGPAASRVLEVLLHAVAGASAQGDFEAMERIKVVLINRLDFAAIAEDQAEAVITTVLRLSPDNAVAAGWLDAKLLRGESAARVTRTLELLDQAQAEQPLSKPIAEAYASLIFTVPTRPAPDASDTTLRLMGRITLESANHGMVRALESADSRQRELAWRALRHFRVVPGHGETDGLNGSDSAMKTFESVLAKGLDLDPTPASLVDFIDNHAHTEIAGTAALGMLRLLTDADVQPAIATRAAERVVGSQLEFETVLSGLAPTQQLTVVNALYAQLEGDTPLVAGLIAEPGSGLSRWFAQRLAQGDLPTGKQWAEQVGTQAAGGGQQLLSWAASPDPNIASAAAAALVSNAGGTAEEQQRFAQAVGNMAERDQTSVGEAWSALQTKLYAKALGDAAGPYNLVVTLAGNTEEFNEFDLSGPSGNTPAKRIELGRVQLKAEGTTVSLSAASVRVSVSPDRLAIRIESLATLRTLNNPALADLPLSQLEQPLDLVPQEDGAWSGKTLLPDGREITVALEPAE